MFIIEARHIANPDKLFHVDVEKTIPIHYYLSTTSKFEFDNLGTAQAIVNMLIGLNVYPSALYTFNIVDCSDAKLDQALYDSVANEVEQIKQD